MVYRGLAVAPAWAQAGLFRWPHDHPPIGRQKRPELGQGGRFSRRGRQNTAGPRTAEYVLARQAIVLGTPVTKLASA